jgi:GT2 family glycosyltransferase
MTQPDVTLVVVPRERFSFARRSLESIVLHTEPPYALVYVDGNSPGPVRRYLETRTRELGFRHLRLSRYLLPNEARNIGLKEVQTRYVVFIDNDVLVRPGWLTLLLACAEETGAWVVGPLYLEAKPGAEVIHMAGGDLVSRPQEGRETLYADMRLYGAPEDSTRLERQATDLAEFHCMLVRRDVFDRLGPLDENMMTTREHVDFCMAVRRAGGSIYFEPRSAISYVPADTDTLEWYDLRYHLFRWNDARTLATIRHFERKWDVKVESYRPDIMRTRRRRAIRKVLRGLLTRRATAV